MSTDKMIAEQTEILRSIWAEMKGLNARVDKTNVGLGEVKAEIVATNVRLDATNERLDTTNERLDATNERLDTTNHRLDRVEQGLNDLGDFMRDIARDQARHERFHLKHVDLLEEDVRDLKARVSKLEAGDPP